MIEALNRIVAGLTARDALTALVDILIVYYAIYRVLLLIKGTRAAQMVIGLVLIGAGFFAATQLELTTVSWLLDNFINYFIIIIIVVFQHDIRRGLVRIGQNLFSFGRTYEETHVFEEVIHAAEHLARSRIGAIIVFEREGDVSELVDTGRILDAQVSRELLVALFVPSRDNVLHDGAAILKNLRVQQAGAVLPLSGNTGLDPELGTRHRAAIGVTEETDAVALVVSEERGEMSLCFHGNIARDLDAATLRKALLGLFYREKGKKRRVAEEAKAAAAAALGLAAFAQRDSRQRPAVEASGAELAAPAAAPPGPAAEAVEAAGPAEAAGAPGQADDREADDRETRPAPPELPRGRPAPPEAG